MIGLGPRCMYCKHFNRQRHGRCAAFAGRIPATFILGEAEHLTPYDGDHGIQFELDPNLSAESLRNYKDRFEKKTPSDR